MRACLLSFILLLIPTATHAALIISEIAWMGSTQSVNHEWIELQNTEVSVVDVTGWQLTDGMNLTIPLEGTISPGAFVVLERTSDASAAGTAFLIYTGALVNTGATLVLKRNDGGIEDQVAGGSDWKSIGGDNLTKETAQLTNAGWVTGAPTPGSSNFGTASNNNDPPEEEDDDSTTVSNPPPTSPITASSRSRSSSETVRLGVKDSALNLKIDGQKVGYVNQSIDFIVKPSGIGRQLEASLQYDWNFGDGNTGNGKELKHAFSYPGTYVVTVFGSFANQKQLARHEITILPVALTVTKSPKGDVQLNNDSPYEIDISGYQVSAQNKFVFPPYSVLLPNQTITLAKEKIGSGEVVVKDTEGVVTNQSVSSVAMARPTASFSAIWQNESSHNGNKAEDSGNNDGRFSFVEPKEDGEIIEESIDQVSETMLPPTVSGEQKPVSNPWPYISLIIIILIGLIGTAFKATRNQTE